MSGGADTLPVFRIGFLALTDAAVVIAAAAKGFDRAEGVRIVLARENSWASLRDKLVVGLLDAAHILAPLAMATHLGIGHLQKTLVVPVRLSLDGNVIVVSVALGERLAAAGYDGSVATLAEALARVARVRLAETGAPLTMATVFPASSHHALMRRIARDAGLTEGTDIRFAVLAPLLMVDALASGLIDGFCAGAPWGSVSVERGVGHIVGASVEFAAGRTEKVLALTAQTADQRSGAVAALCRAMAAAARWCADAKNHPELAGILADPAHLDLPAAIVARTLEGALICKPGDAPRLFPGFITLGGPGVTRPDVADLEDVLKDIGEDVSVVCREKAEQLFRADIFDSAAVD